jgi:hypothetical protein
MNEPEARHRLAAILAADAAGYSRVMAEDDRVALATLDAARAVFRRHIEAQGGRVIDTAAIGARLLRNRNWRGPRRARHSAKALSPCPRQRNAARLLRIGVHLGDVLEGRRQCLRRRSQHRCPAAGAVRTRRRDGLAAVHGAVASRIRGGFETRAAGDEEHPHPVRAFRLRAEAQSTHRFGRYAVLPQGRILIEATRSARRTRLRLLLALIEQRQRVVGRRRWLTWSGLQSGR